MVEKMVKMQFTVLVEVPFTKAQIEYAGKTDQLDLEDEYTANFLECLDLNENIKLVDCFCDIDEPIEFFGDGD